MTRSEITEPKDLSLYPKTLQAWLRIKQSIELDTILIVEGGVFYIALLDDAHKLSNALNITLNGQDYGEGFVATLCIPKAAIGLVDKHLHILNISYIIIHIHV